MLYRLFRRPIRAFFRDNHYWETLSFFRGVPLFHGLSARQLGRVMAAMQRRHYHAGEKLFEEGQVGKAVFVVKSGKVELSRNTPNGPRILGVLGPGQMFGEMALLEQTPRTASASVVEDGEIYLLYATSLDALVENQPAIGLKLLRNMAVMLSALLRRTNKELDQRMKMVS